MDNKIYRSIQLGLRGEAVKKFVNEWIVNYGIVSLIHLHLYVGKHTNQKEQNIIQNL